MSFSGRTPESLLPRSDSKNPATTCKGITSNGRPCRRPLAAPSPTASPSRGNGVLAVLDDQNAAAFYCWQHKDQAEQLAAQSTQTTLHPLKERSSIDSLVEQVGILDLDENIPEKRKRHHQNAGVKRRETLPSGWNKMESPLMTVPEEIVRSRKPKARPPPPRSNVKFSWACCLQADDDDLPPARVRRDTRDKHSRPHMDTMMPPANTRPEVRYPSQPVTPARPKPSPAPSQTQNLLSLIPPNLSPQITSQLLAELSRPISPADEAGYIYIFWLTPDSEVSKPDDETASSLLDDDDFHVQRSAQTLTRYASLRRASNQVREKRTITLKIGRAANVHRRMTQWTKQCGQNISLIRYYPHTKNNSTSGSASPGATGKVAHVHKVERLIHLELSGQRIMKTECEQCGREHREWFEIEATRVGLKGVDEVVRRWVAWAERQEIPPQQSQYY
ncbi:hypothetical protein H2200_004170 [Cladophialophora chaetospira]|uniref:Bacteriophage T5 Orf172 DNA-binding domain-containing protein n=1 Tax=Cladophialophora chaetospira TaxID=386627 RepID=A0AA39CLU4_9EURO|nr:hypothetical protein H2200_004170 [Cladophialophora chaetospira]